MTSKETRGRVPADLTSLPARPSFLRRAPVALRFGTSGLRGKVSEMTDLEVSVNTRGFVAWLTETEKISSGSIVDLAGDLRESTGRILRAVAHALGAEGHRVEYLGRIPTPALTLHALRRRRAGVMVTGSHIPADRNGIKFVGPEGEVLKEDEPAILAAVDGRRRRLYEDASSARVFDEGGMLREEVALGAPESSGREEYRQRFLDLFGPGALEGARLVVHEHAAVGRDLLVELLADLGAEPLPVGRSDLFEPLDTENLTADRVAFYRDLAREHEGAVAVLSTDGDGDRPLLADERGEVHRGDSLGAIVARLLGARFAAVPISTSDAVDRFLSPEVTLRRTKIGSPYVIAAMNRALADGRRGVVGWEANGGFLTASSLELEGRRLEPLPTRDAVLPLLAVLVAARRAGGSLSSLMATLPARFARSGLIDGVPSATGLALLRRFSPSRPPGLRTVEFHGDEVRIALSEGVPGPVQEASLLEELRSCREELRHYMGASEGFGPITRLELLDGLRITFEGGEVAHLRPSGNAPQLRLYVLSDSASRSEEILSRGLAEPAGILRRMERAARASRTGPEAEA